MRAKKYGNQRVVGVVLLRHSGEVHAAADVGAGHHGGHLGQALVIAEEAVDSEVGDQRTHHGAQGAAEEDRQHLAGLLPDLFEVALQQQQGDAHGADDAPDDVVVQNAVDGDDADVGHDHGQDQCDDGAGYLGCPVVLLLQPDGQSYGNTHGAQQAPGVVRRDQGMPDQSFKQHTLFLPNLD